MRILSKCSLNVALMCLALTAVAVGTAGAQDENPLLGLLEKSGLKFDKLEDDIWIVPFQGKDDQTMKVYLTYSDDTRKFALIFTTVVDREPDFVFNREVLRECMKINNDYPVVKFVLDEKEGDLDCQTEALMETLSAEALSLYINNVASIADENAANLNQLAGGKVPEE